MTIMHRIVIGLSLLLLASCSANIERYHNQQPTLQPSNFFSGQLLAVGVIQDFSGEVTRRFTANIVGQWQGNQGLLDEQFFFDDGEEQWRCWRLEHNENRLTGSAGDVIGTAEGVISGNTLHWQYVLRVALEDGDTIDLTLDDWLYLVSEDHLINRTTLRKWGIPVGEITLAIHRISDEPNREPRPECQLNLQRGKI